MPNWVGEHTLDDRIHEAMLKLAVELSGGIDPSRLEEPLFSDQYSQDVDYGYTYDSLYVKPLARVGLHVVELTHDIRVTLTENETDHYVNATLHPPDTLDIPASAIVQRRVRARYVLSSYPISALSRDIVGAAVIYPSMLDLLSSYRIEHSQAQVDTDLDSEQSEPEARTIAWVTADPREHVYVPAPVPERPELSQMNQGQEAELIYATFKALGSAVLDEMAQTS
jgi:hypothetical protein